MMTRFDHVIRAAAVCFVVLLLAARQMAAMVGRKSPPCMAERQTKRMASRLASDRLWRPSMAASRLSSAIVGPADR
jgi:hypothetical protein